MSKKVLIMWDLPFKNSEKNFEKIKHIIEHELTHMYNDYKLQQKGLKTFFELFKLLNPIPFWGTW